MLRLAGERVYGYDSSNDRLLVSGDRGRSWSELEKAGPLVDLAVDPSDDRRIVVASAGGLGEGLFESRGLGPQTSSPQTAAWADAEGMNLMSSTLVFDDASGDPFHLVQARHIHAFREALQEAGHERCSAPSADS